MAVIDPTARSFAVKKRRVWFRAALAACLAVFALLASLAPDMGAAPRGLLYASAAFLAILAWEAGRRSLGGAPGLVVSGEGIELPHVGSGVIPWSAIDEIRRMRGGTALNVTLTPEGAGGLRRLGLWRFLSPRRRRAPIDLRALVGAPEAIVGEIEGRWRAAHGFAARGPLRQPRPPPHDRAPSTSF
jgi:hypothetical protein